MVELKIDISQLRDLEEKISKSENNKKRFMVALGAKTSEIVKNEARVVNTTGQLINSVIHRETDDDVTIYAVNYASIAMETGRAPGYVSPQQLRRWARLKFGNESLAYPIAKKISRHGTRLFRLKTPRLLTSSVSKLNKILSDEVSNFIDTLLK